MKDDRQICKQAEIAACFSGNTKNFFRFDVDENQSVKGVLYISKDSAVPDFVVVHLKTKGEIEVEKKGKG